MHLDIAQSTVLKMRPLSTDGAILILVLTMLIPRVKPRQLVAKVMVVIGRFPLA